MHIITLKGACKKTNKKNTSLTDGDNEPSNQMHLQRKGGFYNLCAPEHSIELPCCTLCTPENSFSFYLYLSILCSYGHWTIRISAVVSQSCFIPSLGTQVWTESITIIPCSNQQCLLFNRYFKAIILFYVMFRKWFCSCFVCSVQFCLTLIQFSLTMPRSFRGRRWRWLTGFARWSKWQTRRQRGRRWSWEACRLHGHFAQLQNNSTVLRGIKGHSEIYLRHIEMCYGIRLPGHTYTSQCEKCYPTVLYYIQLVHIWLGTIILSLHQQMNYVLFNSCRLFKLPL